MPTDEAHLREAERELGRSLPKPLRERLLRDNGGEVTITGYPDEDEVWQLHPVWDPSDRKRASRSANHIVRETREAASDLPAGAVVIAANGTGDLLVLASEPERVSWWDPASGELHPVEVDWS